MAIHPIVRIPCILAAMVGLTVTTTPPVPPPSPGERLPAVGVEQLILSKRLLPAICKSICWLFAIAEMAIILAFQWPKNAISQFLLSKLVFGGSPANIGTTMSFFLGAAMAALGGCLRWLCYRELGSMFTFEMTIRRDHRLVTSGPYSRVRHPGYTGVMLAIPGIIIWHAAQGSYARECGLLNTYFGRGCAVIFLTISSGIMAGLLRRMAKEDKALENKFGKEWRDWAQDVPYKLIPWIF